MCDGQNNLPTSAVEAESARPGVKVISRDSSRGNEGVRWLESDAVDLWRNVDQPLQTDNKDVVLLLCSVTNHLVSMLPCWFLCVCVCVCVCLLTDLIKCQQQPRGLKREREKTENKSYFYFIFCLICLRFSLYTPYFNVYINLAADSCELNKFRLTVEAEMFV